VGDLPADPLGLLRLGRDDDDHLPRPLDSIGQNLLDVAFRLCPVGSRGGHRRVTNLGTVAPEQILELTHQGIVLVTVADEDVVVVAIGEDIQASILTTLILKEMGIPTTVVKAVNDLHGKVLKKIGADKVVYPERDMGQRVAHHLISSNIIDYIELSADYSIVEIKVSTQMIGKSLKQLDIRAKYGCNVIAIKQNEQLIIPPIAEEPLRMDDILVIVGKNSNLQTFEVTFAE